MGWFNRKKRAEVISLIPPQDPAINRLFGINIGSAGVDINTQNVIEISAVFSAINLISSTVGTLPLNMYRKTRDKIEICNDKVGNTLVATRPNSFQTPSVMRRVLQWHALQYGDGFAEIQRLDDKEKTPIAIVPFANPRVVKPTFRDGVHCYEVKTTEKPRYVESQNMIHIMGPSADGIRGLCVADIGRQSLAVGYAAERFASAFFGNGLSLSGVVSHPLELSDQAEKRVEEKLETAFKGPDKAFKILFLDENMQFQTMMVVPEEAQMLETREFSIADVCRWFRVPPHMLYLMEASTFNSVEQQNIDFLTHTMSAWFRSWSEQLNAKLCPFDPSEKEEYFFAYDTIDIQTQDMQTRFEAYSTARNGGWFSLNDILRREKQSLLPKDIGESHLAPSTMKTLERTDFGNAVDIEAMSASMDFIKTNGPMTEEQARAILDGTCPEATDALVASLLEILRSKKSIT